MRRSTHRLRPRFYVIPARAPGHPKPRLFLCARLEIITENHMETAAGKRQLLGRLGGGQNLFLEGFQHMPDKGAGEPLGELLVLFINRAYRIAAAPTINFSMNENCQPVR
jgi:hypothetical protein